MSVSSVGLSSNWKSLQSKIQAQDGQTKPLKRRAAKVFDEGKGAPKKARRASFRSKKPQEMGSSSSMPRQGRSSAAEPAATGLSEDKESISESLPASRPARAGKYIAIDCEMVGTLSHTPCAIKSRNDAQDFSILARVSIVSFSQDVLYDTYVLPLPDVRVSDYRTRYSGITSWHLSPRNEQTQPKPFEQVQKEVAALIKGRTLVGHAIKNDLAVLGLSHPARHTRDTARYPPFRAMTTGSGLDGMLRHGRTPALRMLAQQVLGWEIQNDVERGHSSVEDAKATMALFQREKKGFEQDAIKTFGRSAVAAAAEPSLSERGEVADGSGKENRAAEGEEDDDLDSDDLDELDDIRHDGTSTTTAGNTVEQGKKKKKKKKKKGKYHR